MVGKVGVVKTHTLLQAIMLSQDQGFLVCFGRKVSGR